MPSARKVGTRVEIVGPVLFPEEKRLYTVAFDNDDLEAMAKLSPIRIPTASDTYAPWQTDARKNNVVALIGGLDQAGEDEPGGLPKRRSLVRLNHSDPGWALESSNGDASDGAYVRNSIIEASKDDEADGASPGSASRPRSRIRGSAPPIGATFFDLIATGALTGEELGALLDLWPSNRVGMNPDQYASLMHERDPEPHGIDLINEWQRIWYRRLAEQGRELFIEQPKRNGEPTQHRRKRVVCELWLAVDAQRPDYIIASLSGVSLNTVAAVRLDLEERGFIRPRKTENRRTQREAA